MQVWHIAMHASSIAIIDAGVMPCGRIMARIMVLHMSAQFMHAGAHDIICVEHTVHACSQAEQASIHACMTFMSIMSMPGIDIMSFDMASIIIESISRSSLSSATASRR
jgi:hydroxypyruvate isomerase